MSNFVVGIIGGTGLEDPQILTDVQKFEVSTPFGNPSSPLVKGKIGGVDCVLISRHGVLHEYSPSRINYRANIWALKQAGVDVIIASSASGSLRQEMAPGHVVFVNSFIDRTTKREQSFYDGIPDYLLVRGSIKQSGRPTGICHMPMHPLFSEALKTVLKGCAQDLGIWYHTSGTTVCIEGPRFSTRAESDLYRSWGAHLVGMTVCPEVVLAKELGIPYANVAIVTDYDCWKDSHEGVSIELVAKTLQENAKNMKNLFVKTVVALENNEEIIRKEISVAKNLAKSSVMCGTSRQINFDYIEMNNK